MLISEYLQTRGISVTTGNVSGLPDISEKNQKSRKPEDSDFARELQSQLAAEESAVVFSKHAMDRLAERDIDLNSDNTLERLNKAVELAGEKGSNDALVMIGANAFIVSVKNNKVITTLSAEDMQGNIFTNIDSTVIM
ncbi:MAG: TIGR02530 family flagellar biosynthesis protein [Huintestinicola sp.]